MHFLEGNQLFPPSVHSLLPFSAVLIPTLPSNWLSCFGRGLSWDGNSKRGEESLFASNLREYYGTRTEQRTKLKQRSSRFCLCISGFCATILSRSSPVLISCIYQYDEFPMTLLNLRKQTNKHQNLVYSSHIRRTFHMLMVTDNKHSKPQKA